MPCFYLQPEQRDYNQIPELQICIAEVLYDIESVLADPSVFPEQELMRLRDQIINNLERAWEITGGSEDELTGTMVQISQVVAREIAGSGEELASMVLQISQVGGPRV
jgi:hypothetical protein